jgi:hypothetical protein
MRKQWAMEQKQAEQDLLDGLIDQQEYNDQMKDMDKEEAEYYQETEPQGGGEI